MAPWPAPVDIVVADDNFHTLKVSPSFYQTDLRTWKSYLKEYNLPNEWDYFDPAKADEKRECGLHVSWGGKAAGKGSGVEGGVGKTQMYG